MDSEIKSTDWLSRLFAALRPRDTGAISNLDDFSPPCQIHFFWFTRAPDIEYTCLLRARLTGLPDGCLEVIGPIHPADADAELSQVVGRDYWSEEIHDPNFLTRRSLYRPTHRDYSPRSCLNGRV